MSQKQNWKRLIKCGASFNFFFLIPESNPDLCIKYRIKKPKPEKSEKIQSEKKEKRDSSKDDVSLVFMSNEGMFVLDYPVTRHL